MKNVLTSLFIWICAISFSQKQTLISLDWKDTPLLLSGEITDNIPHFQDEYFSYDQSIGKILFVYKELATNQNNFEITNIAYENISKKSLGNLNTELIPTQLKQQVHLSKSREKTFLYIEISPIIKDGNSFKRIKSFTLKPTFDSRTTHNTTNTNFVPNVSNSVLSNGQWFRFYVEKSGVYKISKSFIESLGMNLDNIDPRKIKIYGNGGRMLPMLNSIEYPFDLTENAILCFGEQDGSFDEQDYILFYAEGLDTYNQESDTHLNLYSDRSYYYITTNGFQNGKRIATMIEPTQNPTITTNQFDDYQFHEKDLNNFARLGRKWFGEAFNVQNQQTFSFSFPNLITSVPLNFRIVTGLNSPYRPAKFTFKANGEELGNVDYPTGSSLSDNLGREKTITAEKNINSDNVNIEVSFNNNGVPTLNGYLDYIAITARRQLKAFGKQFSFFYDQALNNVGVIEYQITNANSITEVWEVTDIFNVRRKQNSANSTFSFKANMGEKRKYIAVDPNDYYTPLREQNSKVANQNLKGTIFKDNSGNFKDIDYLIVTPEFLNAQAQKLAEFHRNNSNFNVKVVSLETIYQEFSSGKQDIGAIRNFVKYIYYNASSPNKRIKFLNLFGDASFDFKNRISGNTNIVPIYQYFRPNMPSSSFSPLSYVCADDYFVMMDNNEGVLLSNLETPDIAVGRMLVSDVKQAEEMIKKVFDYHDELSYGRWRNNVTLIADDIDRASDVNLQFKLNELADAIQLNKPFFNVNKIYLDSYIQETASGGPRYPQARIDIINAFEAGSLVFNYLGHGGEEGLAHERVFEKIDGQNLNNRYKYPVFVTVTCEFTKFDNPLHPTAGEYTYWNPQGGAVAMVTTTRTVGIGTAQNFNLKLGQIMFSYDDFQGQPYPRIGEALRVAKNEYGSLSSTRMIALIGDPALQLAIPKPNVELTHINDIEISNFTESLQALSKIKIKGRVTDQNTTFLSNYNGELAVQIFDKKISRTTLGNDGHSDNGQLVTMDFDVLGETIFRGNASVKNGLFEFSFVVPKDIRIPIDNGRISFYAKRTNQLEDQNGYSEEIKVGGINENAPQDNTPPTAKLYMNDTSFISGGLTNSSPIFLAFLQDENGMNTAGGIGHDMTAVLDGNETNPFILNDYYQTELDDYTKGKISFPFRNLEPGLHTITFKAWDVYNNMVTTEIQFVVVGNDDIRLEKVLNYPNPFVSYTEFWFSHNRPFEPLEVQVQVFTITGKIIWTKNQTIITQGFLSREITWNGRDDFGDRIGKGVYIYKLTVKSTFTGKKVEKYEKLVLL